MPLAWQICLFAGILPTLYIYEAIQAKLKDNTIVCTSLLINAEFSKLKTSNWASLHDNLSTVVCEQRALFFVY